MKKHLLILLVLLTFSTVKAQYNGVLESGSTLWSFGIGAPYNGIPFEITSTYGIYDDVFGVDNLHFGIENLLSFKIKPTEGARMLTFGAGLNFHYTIFDDFDVFAGVNLGLDFSNFYYIITDTHFEDSWRLNVFYNVGARYTFTDFVGVYLRGGYSNFSYAAAGIYFRL
jgi:hypothetical protein